MTNLIKLVLCFVGVLFLQTQAADKYTDENRPYEFGFTIDGEQHRHEKKDENGIIMGEFGFITADGVYHVTVYATDENGNFKILSMKNIRVKPYPSAAGPEVKKSNSLTSSKAPQKDSIPESTKEEKIIKKQVASPAKSCSHCSLPTTTTTTTASPDISQVSVKFTNSQNKEKYSHGRNDEKFSNTNPILSQKIDNPQNQYISKPYEAFPQTIAPNNPQENQNNKNYLNINVVSSQNVGSQEPNIQPQLYPQSINNQNSPQESVVYNNPMQVINPPGEQYFTPQNRQLGTAQQTSVPGGSGGGGEGIYSPGISNVDISDPQSNQEPISRNLQAPIYKENYQPDQELPQNQKQNDNGVRNYNMINSNNNGHKYFEGQQQNYEKNGTINQASSRQTKQSYNEGEKSVLRNPTGERSPKSFVDFIQQSVSPKELAITGPNLYRPSLPKASDFSEKPVLLAAQMQIVDKNTNIYNKNTGESEGLPRGITIDDMTNLLYTFNYSVGFHGHHEKGYSNGAKQGYYYVTGRNGVRTRVDYVADENGFRPKITQEILDIVSDEVPKPETEKDEKYGLKGYEFKWLYFPLDSKPL